MSSPEKVSDKMKRRPLLGRRGRYLLLSTALLAGVEIMGKQPYDIDTEYARTLEEFHEDFRDTSRPSDETFSSYLDERGALTPGERVALTRLLREVDGDLHVESQFSVIHTLLKIIQQDDNAASFSPLFRPTIYLHGRPLLTRRTAWLTINELGHRGQMEDGTFNAIRLVREYIENIHDVSRLYAEPQFLEYDAHARTDAYVAYYRLLNDDYRLWARGSIRRYLSLEPIELFEERNPTYREVRLSTLRSNFITESEFNQFLNLVEARAGSHRTRHDQREAFAFLMMLRALPSARFTTVERGAGVRELIIERSPELYAECMNFLNRYTATDTPSLTERISSIGNNIRVLNDYIDFVNHKHAYEDSVGNIYELYLMSRIPDEVLTRIQSAGPLSGEQLDEELTRVHEELNTEYERDGFTRARFEELVAYLERYRATHERQTPLSELSENNARPILLDIYDSMCTFETECQIDTSKRYETFIGLLWNSRLNYINERE